MTNNINHFKEIVDNAWVKHTKDQFPAPTAKDMDILIKTCLMPLALKTQNGSFIFVHELKQEMHADLKYVENIEKEIDKLESDKAEFSNMYDMILQECMSNEVMCSYLLSLSDLDALAELQCLYLHKVKEYDCLAQKLSKQTESVSKEVYIEISWRFAKLEKHSISLELALQKCKEQGQFYDADLEVAFRKSTCFVRDLQGNDLLTVSKAKRSSFKSKAVPSSKGRLNLLHMNLCGPMRVASINGKKYIVMKEKRDPCILVGYSTQSKGYCVYNKRTRLIFESIHIRFDEIKEMSETSVANDTSGLVPKQQKRSTLSPIECLKWCSLDARMIAVIVRELDQRLILDGKETLALERESRSKLNKDLVHALDELRCLYLHKVKECDSLAQKLSKQIKSVSKAVHTELLQHLKAQLRDKNIAISELKKLIEKGKGKSMKTKFDKPSVVRQPNAQRIPKPSVLVTAQTLPQTAKQAVSNTNVLKPRMYRINNRPTQTRAPQLPQTVRNTNPHVSTSIGVNHKPNVSRPRHKSNQSRDKVLPNNSQVKVKKTQVEVHPRIPSVSNKMKSVTVCKDSLYSRTLNANDVCATCNKCLVDYNHFACVTKMPNDVNARTKKPNVVPISTRKPKSQANKSVATPHKKKIVQLILFIVDSGCMKHMTGNLNLLCNFVEKFLCTVYFGNDQFAPILGYGKLVQGNVTINRVYYVEGLNHNLFSIGQFCDADLEVAFRKSTCFVKDLQGNDLLTGNRRSDLYTISLQELTSSIPFYLMAKASPTQAWLWHQRLSHLNFDYINLLLKKDVVIGLPKLKYVKDQLCSSCELSKAKRSSFKLKFVPSSKRRLNLLHMDSCGLMQKKEKDKTVTKPDENGKRGRARQCKSPVTVKKAEKEKKYRLKGPILENPKSVFNSS
nr:retrovirus-related Pol polyprotein from transposon TNT 1-94 [Tanacetum cinerariifolium]